jgi:hypothetical protein
MRSPLVFVVSLALVTTACGSPQRGSGTGGSAANRAAARPAGCEIEVVREGVPARPTNLQGEAVARCTHDAANEAQCMRQLQDEACRLGAVVIWNVRSQPMELTEGIEMRAAAGTYR